MFGIGELGGIRQRGSNAGDDIAHTRKCHAPATLKELRRLRQSLVEPKELREQKKEIFGVCNRGNSRETGNLTVHMMRQNYGQELREHVYFIS